MVITLHWLCYDWAHCSVGAFLSETNNKAHTLYQSRVDALCDTISKTTIIINFINNNIIIIITHWSRVPPRHHITHIYYRWVSGVCLIILLLRYKIASWPNTTKPVASSFWLPDHHWADYCFWFYVKCSKWNWNWLFNVHWRGQFWWLNVWNSLPWSVLIRFGRSNARYLQM